MKLDYRKIFLLGFGFFSVSIAWPIYNNYVPILLEHYIKNGLMIGFIMTFDNIAAVVFQPLFGALSDITHTRFGRRMPYLLIGIPLAAIFFSLIPLAFSLPILMISVILMNLSMGIYRAPAVALMPDITPSPLRSKANGIINLMGGIAAVIALGLGGILYKVNSSYPFYMGSIIMLLAVIVMYLFVKEPHELNSEEEQNKPATTETTKDKGKLLSLILLLLAIFFWFTGFNVIETFFSLYGKEILGINPGQSALMLTIFSAAFVLFAIPAGFIASKYGRKKTILTGLIGCIVVFASMIFARDVNVIRPLLLLGGIFWAAININSYPMVVEMVSAKGIGTYTGYYYFFASAASIVTPVLFGWISDMVGSSYRYLFLYSSANLFLAFLLVLLVKHGETTPAPSSALEIASEL